MLSDIPRSDLGTVLVSSLTPVTQRNGCHYGEGCVRGRRQWHCCSLEAGTMGRIRLCIVGALIGASLSSRPVPSLCGAISSMFRLGHSLCHLLWLDPS